VVKRNVVKLSLNPGLANYHSSWIRILLPYPFCSLAGRFPSQVNMATIFVSPCLTHFPGCRDIFGDSIVCSVPCGENADFGGKARRVLVLSIRTRKGNVGFITTFSGKDIRASEISANWVRGTSAFSKTPLLLVWHDLSSCWHQVSMSWKSDEKRLKIRLKKVPEWLTRTPVDSSVTQSNSSFAQM